MTGQLDRVSRTRVTFELLRDTLQIEISHCSDDLLRRDFSSMEEANSEAE